MCLLSHSEFQWLTSLFLPTSLFLDFRVKLVFSNFSSRSPVPASFAGFSALKSLRFWFGQNAGYKRERNKTSSVEAKVRIKRGLLNLIFPYSLFTRLSLQ